MTDALQCPWTESPCTENGSDKACLRDGCWKEKMDAMWPQARPDHRKAPMPPGFNSKNQPGWCRWCSREIWADFATRKLARAQWHRDCLGEYFVLTRPSATRDAVRARDGGRCCDCGEVAGVKARKGVEGIWIDDRQSGSRRYTEVLWIEEWQVDHHVPLWSVAHLPDAERVRYFTLENARTRCTRCHLRKTKREAAERAKIERLRATDGMRAPKKSKAAKRAASAERWRNMP